MPRAQGFARGDIDTAFPLDDKFLALRGRLTAERYYAATGVYFTVVAATWREAERKVALRVAPDAADLIDELVAVGLLTADGRVSTKAFTTWIGRAKRNRKVTSDRQARNRAGKAISQSDVGDTSDETKSHNPVQLSRDVTRDNGVTNGLSQPARASAPLRSEGTDEDVEGGPGGDDRDSLDTYYELTLYRPWGVWSGDKIRGAIVDYGDESVDAAMRAEHGADPDRSTLLDRTLARLAREAEHHKRERKDRPRPVRPKADQSETNREILRLMSATEAS